MRSRENLWRLSTWDPEPKAPSNPLAAQRQETACQLIHCAVKFCAPVEGTRNCEAAAFSSGSTPGFIGTAVALQLDPFSTHNEETLFLPARTCRATGRVESACLLCRVAWNVDRLGEHRAGPSGRKASAPPLQAVRKISDDAQARLNPTAEDSEEAPYFVAQSEPKGVGRVLPWPVP